MAVCNNFLQFLRCLRLKQLLGLNFVSGGPIFEFVIVRLLADSLLTNSCCWCCGPELVCSCSSDQDKARCTDAEELAIQSNRIKAATCDSHLFLETCWARKRRVRHLQAIFRYSFRRLWFVRAIDQSLTGDCALGFGKKGCEQMHDAFHRQVSAMHGRPGHIRLRDHRHSKSLGCVQCHWQISFSGVTLKLAWQNASNHGRV